MTFTAHDEAGQASPDDAGLAASRERDGQPEEPRARRARGHVPLPPNSVNDESETKQRIARPFLVHPRDWAFWTQRTRLIVYMLTCDVAVVVGIVLTALNAPAPTRVDWFRFAALAVCATIHLQLTRRQEERRRSRKPTVQIDLAGIWSFAAIVVLPIHVAVLVIVFMRTQRWYVARRPLYMYTFSTASLLLGAMATHGVMGAFGPRVRTQLDVSSSFAEFGILLIAAVVYFAVQAVVIGIGIFLNTTGTPTLQAVLGTKEDNALDAVTIALGIVAAILLINIPAALAIMVVISVVGNRVAEVRQLQVDVRTDPKTGLLNMRGWHEAAGRALERSTRANARAALLMVDLDHFKSINDTWGHPAGDDVLEVVASALRSATRPSDVIGRFGGEEFVLLLPEADTDEAVAAGERIRQTISELEVPTTDKRGGPVAIANRTTSVGIAVYPHHGFELDDLLQVADAAVYEAKENGRDQVQLADRMNHAKSPSGIDSGVDSGPESRVYSSPERPEPTPTP